MQALDRMACSACDHSMAPGVCRPDLLLRHADAGEQRVPHRCLLACGQSTTEPVTASCEQLTIVSRIHETRSDVLFAQDRSVRWVEVCQEGGDYLDEGGVLVRASIGHALLCSAKRSRW